MPRSYVKVSQSPGVRRPGAKGNGKLKSVMVKPISRGPKLGPLPTMQPRTMPSMRPTETAASKRGLARPPVMRK